MKIFKLFLCLVMLLSGGLSGCAQSTLVAKTLSEGPYALHTFVINHKSFPFEEKKINESAPLNTNEWTLAKPNELGEVMIIMYHRLAENEGVYVKSIDNFKGDLDRLYQEGYRPVSMSSYIKGEIDLPAGLSPVILTFDDGHMSNFKYEDDQTTISADSVVGIFLDFQKEHPDFQPRGVFYLTGPTPFGQRGTVEKKLKTLVELGFEVGNHTASHKALSGLNAESISSEIGSMNKVLEGLSGHRVTHLSIPYGKRPKDSEGLNALVESQNDAFDYHMESIVNVGWKPVLSPYHNLFNPLSLNRVTSELGDFGLHYWMDYFQKYPQRRYVSDGDMSYISIYETDAMELRPIDTSINAVRTYTLED